MPPEQYCYLQNRILPLWEARIAPDDLGILRGFAIYEGIAAFGKYPFHFKEHWARFTSSAKALGLRVPLSEDDAFNACAALIKKNLPEGGRSSLRMVLSGGPAINGIEYDPTRTVFYILCDAHKALPATLYEKGATLVSHDHQRMLPEFKTVNYITAVMLQTQRKQAGAIDVLYYHNGQAFECATSNIFIVEDGRVVTPKEGVLPGITRSLALKMAQEGGHTAEEADVTMDEVFAASEVFITSSFRDIVPIVKIDGKDIGDGKPGTVTRELIQKFTKYIKDGGQG